MNTFIRHGAEDQGIVLYDAMIKRLFAVANEQFITSKGIRGCHLRGEEEELLFTICEDFAESNNFKMVSKIQKAAFLKVGGDHDGTKIHFDEAPEIDTPTKDGTRIKAWIPLSDIDNYPLAVGDARSYLTFDGVCKGDNSIGKCATKREFKDAVWYQKENMTPMDAVFWNKQTVPHCSLNLGNDRKTKERIALLFEFTVQDIE